MGGIFGSTPAPAPPPAPPPPPSEDDPAVEEARRKELVAAQKSRGRASTLLTGGSGALQRPLTKTSLLGG
jgi:hypothetical protein